MEPTAAIIRARSERQAMDWSLVLVSQGIETRIERGEENRGWQLVVDPPDHERALLAIRHYRAENRGRAWLQELPWTGLIFDWRSVAWFVLPVILLVLSETRFPHLRASGVMDSDAVRSGEWWRLFTAITLHQDLGHLAANVTTGVVLLGLAMGSFGSGFGLLGAYLAGVGGNLAGLFLYAGPHRGLGASGMVMGALGLLTVQSLALLRIGLPPRQLLLRGLLGGLLLLILLGLDPSANTDVIAHVAGFATGGLLGGFLVLLPPALARSAWANQAAELVCGALMVFTWWLALR